MDRVWIFYAIQIAASVFALWRGGAPERVLGLALLLAAVSTQVLQDDMAVRFAGVELDVLLVDLALLAVMLAITLHADRFWPAWATALHLLGTGAHLARAISPDVIRLTYAVLAAAWSYPIVVLLVIGTLRHASRIRSKGWDLDWSRQDPTLR
ncbi:hypothetical protein FSB78_12455 [Sphingomonas ginsenosidivorax]|uniref:Uncharacterized protein n=1 Tax=Sphingomonas ginsenosidivorax TaxID=862135 RepID=A0A5C6UHI4_9SPHN|nr:hypothetical protein [Sphingomonas ginsenosidivorax]TXC71666.1 hypothetical protein FSB78_12455 [Sphingomonas ginsenosidivorax]